MLLAVSKTAAIQISPFRARRSSLNPYAPKLLKNNKNSDLSVKNDFSQTTYSNMHKSFIPPSVRTMITDPILRKSTTDI